MSPSLNPWLEKANTQNQIIERDNSENILRLSLNELRESSHLDGIKEYVIYWLKLLVSEYKKNNKEKCKLNEQRA